MTIQSANMTLFQTIQMRQWSKDHWSLLLYVHSVAEACGYFELGCDARLRLNRLSLVALKSGCPSPFRPTPKGRVPALKGAEACQVMRPEHSTQIKGGIIIDNHDDLHTLVDLAAHGLLTALQKEVLIPGMKFSLSDRGIELANQLLEFKGEGGKFKDFEPDLKTTSTIK